MPISETESAYKPIIYGQQTPIGSGQKEPSITPESHQDRLVGRYAGKGYKQLVVDYYLAIFKIDKTSKKVFVLTVQYQGRNI